MTSASIESFDAYIDTRDDTGVPFEVSAAAHAEQQAELAAASLAALDAKYETQRADLVKRLAVVRSDLAKATVILTQDTDYPHIAQIYEAIVQRETKYQATLDALDATHASAHAPQEN